MPGNILNDITHISPAVREIPEFTPTGEFTGIRAITYEGAQRGGQRTKIFAYVGFPENTSGKVPGILLIHGGGGHSFLQWIKMWNDRGYAAIAPDVTGFFPTAVNAGSTEVEPSWENGLHGLFKEDGYTSVPDNDGMFHSDSDITEQWMYHALCASSLAFSVLASDNRVDASRIGATGISWGGVILSLLIGYDERLAFAVPVYGSGYLDKSYTWMKDHFAGEKTRELWSAADRFDRVSCPVLWQCWNDDNCFSLNCSSSSYLDTVKNNPATRLSFINLMYHSHGCSWARREPFVFADSVVGKTPELPRFVTQPDGKTPDCTVESPVPLTATLYYLCEPITCSTQERYGYTSTFMDQRWQTSPLSVTDGHITGIIPDDSDSAYIELKTASAPELVVSSRYFKIKNKNINKGV